MFLTDPITSEPSIPFTLFAMECEGDIKIDKEEEENEDDESICPRPAV